MRGEVEERPKDEERRSGTTTKPVLIIIFIFRAARRGEPSLRRRLLLRLSFTLLHSLCLSPFLFVSVRSGASPRQRRAV